MNMTKSQLISLLSEKSPAFMEDDVTIAVQTILDSISRTLENGNRVEIRGFGSFGLNYRPLEKEETQKVETRFLFHQSSPLILKLGRS